MQRHMIRPAPGILLRGAGLVFLTLLAIGCSRIQLAYHNLDWLLPHYLGSYMPLSDDQDHLLDARVDQFLNWHCSTQVGTYARLLREANTRFQHGTATRRDLEAFNARVEQAWAAILAQAAPAIADVLASADSAQVQALFDGLDERNQAWLEDFERSTPETQRRDYRKRMGKELRRWFGRLDAAQQQALDDWSAQFQPLGLEGFAVRQRWQRQLRETLAGRKNHDRFEREFAALLTGSSRFRTPPYQARLDHNRAVTVDLVFNVVSTLSDTQKRHLQDQVDAVAGDFDSLACRGEAMASSR